MTKPVNDKKWQANQPRPNSKQSIFGINLDKTDQKQANGQFARLAGFAHPDCVHALSEKDEKEKKRQLAHLEKSTLNMISALKPQDQYEAILMEQMTIGQHWLSYSLNQANHYLIKGGFMETKEFGLKMMKTAQKFMSLYTQQLACLDKHRQPLTASTMNNQVNVNQGGQAIVGNLTVKQKNRATHQDDHENGK